MIACSPTTPISRAKPVSTILSRNPPLVEFWASAKARPDASFRRRTVAAFFIVALVVNVAAVSVGWFNLNLPGCEFRQAQTAISALFIQREHDFSLEYPTPVLGSPWSIPMEFPLYQWTTVLVSNVTGWSLTSAARATSALCFYCTLPALFLLLRHFGFGRGSSLVALTLVLTCPLYIFYTRAFLIETMALMFGAWYFCACTRWVAQKDTRWLALGVVAGVAAALVKVTTWIVFFLPAVAWWLAVLWQNRPANAGNSWRSCWTMLGRFALAQVFPLLAILWWLNFSDTVKLQNPSGQMLTSGHLFDWNFGVGRRFAADVWQAHGRIILREIISPVSVSVVLAGVFLVPTRFRIFSAVSLGVFLVTQAIFPLLYAWHEYYYVANAFALMLAAGIVLGGLLELERTPRWLFPPLVAVVLLVQIATWWNFHRPRQAARSPGGSGLTALLKYLTAPEDVLIVAGDDWNSMIPYFSERRALMIRDEVQRDPQKLNAALSLMRRTPVAALVLCGQQRENTELLEHVKRDFGLDRRAAFSSSTATVFLTTKLRTEAFETLARRQFHDVSPAAVTEPSDPSEGLKGREVSLLELAPRHRALFRTMHPMPIRFYSSLGPDLWEETGALKFYAHPETRLDFKLSAGHHRIRTLIELVAAAYNGSPAAAQSDGVTLLLIAKFPEERREVIQKRDLNPRDIPADRGRIEVDWSFVLPPDAELELAVTAGPSANNLKDWATLGPLTIE